MIQEAMMIARGVIVGVLTQLAKELFCRVLIPILRQRARETSGPLDDNIVDWLERWACDLSIKDEDVANRK